MRLCILTLWAQVEPATNAITIVSTWRWGDIMYCCGIGSPSSMVGFLMQYFIITLEVTALAPLVLDIQILLVLQMMRLLIYFE